MVIRVLDSVDAPKTEPGHSNDSSLSTLMNAEPSSEWCRLQRLRVGPGANHAATGHPWLHGHVYELRQGTRSAHQFLGDPWIRYWP